MAPPLDTTRIVYSVAAVVLVWVIAKILRSGSREAHLPPGPKTIPVLGNLHQLPLAYAHVQFTKWAKEYGPIYSLKAGSQTMVVLTGPKEVKELLDRRSATSSDRPDLHVANEIITNGRHLLAMPYTDRWRLVRKIIHQHLTIKMCEEHHQKVQSAESAHMIMQLIEKPEDFYRRVQRYSTGVILSIIFGRRGPTFEGAVQDIYDVMEPWSEIVETGATPPVDIFPFIKLLPDFASPWRKKAQHVRNLELKLYGDLAKQVRARREQGIDRGSLLDKVMDAQQQHHDPILDEEQVAYIGGVLLEGGSDTTSSLLLAFIMAAAKWPDMFAKVQAEVDEVCGRHRMPQFSDYPNLPYVRMCIKEVQRWRPVVIMAFPHKLTQDETYGPYVLPKGTTIIGNTWGLHMDEKKYPDPQTFKPERYADYPLSGPEYAAMSGDDVRDHYGYGYGRRICVGMHIAERSMFINIARIAWAFNIKEDPTSPVDTDGFTPGFLSAPKPFKVDLKPRDDSVVKVVKEELTEAESVFQQYED